MPAKKISYILNTRRRWLLPVSLHSSNNYISQEELICSNLSEPRSTLRNCEKNAIYHANGLTDPNWIPTARLGNRRHLFQKMVFPEYIRCL